MAADGNASSALPLRPPLPDVLACITGESRGAWVAVLRMLGGNARVLRFERDAIRWGTPWQAPHPDVPITREPRVFERPYAITDPAEAWEALQTRGVLALDDGARGWWCARCEGDTRRTELGERICCDCNGGVTPHPATLADLVAFASLGAPAILAAEEHARCIGGREAFIVWRVMTARQIAEHHKETAFRSFNGKHVSPAVTFSRETYIGSVHPGGDWRGPGLVAPETRRHFESLRALAAMGLHQIDATDGRVVIAVPSVGGAR